MTAKAAAPIVTTDQAVPPPPAHDPLMDRGEEPGLLVMIPLGALGFVVSGILRITDALLPPIAAEFATSIGDAAIVVAAFGAAFAIFTFVYGGLGDWLGKLKVIACAGAGAAIATYMGATAQSIPEVAFWRFMAGATVAACIPLSLAYIGDNVAYERRQAALGRYLSGVMLGQILGAALGGIIADMAGWRHVFHLYGVIMLLACAVLGYLVFSGKVRRRPRERAPMRVANYTDILRNRKALHFLALCILEGIVVLGVMAFISALMRARFELSYATIGVLIAGYGFGGLIYSGLVRLLVRHLNEMRLVIVGGVGMACMFAVLAWLQTVKPLFALMVLLGFSFYALHVVLQARATEIAPRTRGAAMAFFSFSLFFGQSLGALIYGQIIDSLSYTYCFAIAAGMVLVLSALVAHGLHSGALIQSARERAE